ncbi:MAG: hypothetical protein V8R40_02705 [Dysosmobacter sp.]
MRLSEKRLNFFGPKGCSPNATAVSPPDFPHGYPGTGSPFDFTIYKFFTDFLPEPLYKWKSLR